MIKNKILHPSSYKDNDAQVYYINNQIFREIKPSYYENYKLLMNSGLYKELISNKLLINHTQCETLDGLFIKPEQVFISYPWEWSFSQLKDAALLTLKILKIALNYNMILKDANCYNVQFQECRPIFIDTTSFEKYEENQAWVAYGQFCNNFIAPLALMAYTDMSLSKLFLANIDGIDLSLTTKLLPYTCRFNINLLIHIYQHSFFQKQYESKNEKIVFKYSKFQLLSLIDSLERCVKNINPKKQKTQWDNYYDITNYTDSSFKQKHDIIDDFKNHISPQTVIDIGANNGEFSRIFNNTAKQILSIDIDPNAIEQNYKKTKKLNQKNLLPLIIDITNPSPAIGVNNQERFSFLKRAQNSDLILALAIIHHLVIGKNIQFYQIAELFAKLGKCLIIEFIDKKDSQIKKLLSNRKDIFEWYNIENFEEVFSKKFKIVKKTKIQGTLRTLYLMERL